MVAAALALNMIVACGSSGNKSEPVRTVTTEDSGSTIELNVGESLRVELGRDYQQPAARPNGVVSRTSAVGGYPTKEPVAATFRATKPGRADIESTTDYECLHATPSCALPQQVWSVHVVVKP